MSAFQRNSVLCSNNIRYIQLVNYKCSNPCYAEYAYIHSVQHASEYTLSLQTTNNSLQIPLCHAAGEQRQGNNTARSSNAFAEGATANFRKQLAVECGASKGAFIACTRHALKTALSLSLEPLLIRACVTTYDTLTVTYMAGFFRGILRIQVFSSKKKQTKIKKYTKNKKQNKTKTHPIRNI